ncbi:response regulator transcription factor [Paenibacillus sp. 1001270B_150601_E10]|uniref:response regulator transcription factor n=1 Tax=Paenibacillus sp. 1001270B_150601_E10 TaxID=2787079 RepID=UPI0018A0D25C|nr:response regulator transcription factor [Paenibacillus sp. 1001270B_150601_E10]
MYNVFLVDDEPFIIEGLEAILEWNDYGLEIVGSANNGEEAWQYLKDHPCDIVVTDITMPKMTGLQLIEKLKDTHSHMRYIILSGYNEFSYVREGIKLGVENYLLKPINLDEFKTTLETTVQKLDQTRARQQAELHNRDILRDNILYRWIRDQIHTEELLQRTELLDIDLNHPYYMVCLIRLETLDKRNQVQQRHDQLDKLDWTWLNKEFEEAYCVREWDGEIALVFGLTKEADKQAVLERLDTWKRKMEERISAYLQITIGSIQSGYLNASASYSHAKQVQPYHLVSMEEPWIDYEEINKYHSSRPSAVRLEIEPYLKLLVDRDKAGVAERLSEDLERLRETDGAEPQDIRNFIVELLIRWSELVKDEEIHLEEETNWFDAIYKVHSIETLKEHVISIASGIIDHYDEPEQRSPVIKQVLTHIEQNYREEMSLKTLAQVFHMSPVYLGQLFQKEVQSTFSDYLNKTRIRAAKQLLIETPYRMTEISEQVGYWDKSYFYKQFKKYVGISPKEYRELHQKQLSEG